MYTSNICNIHMYVPVLLAQMLGKFHMFAPERVVKFCTLPIRSFKKPTQIPKEGVTLNLFVCGFVGHKL